MKKQDRFDQIIHDQIEKHFLELLQDLTPFGWLWVKAQIWQESRMDPEAISPAGAQGLMQLMPATDLEIDGDIDGADVVGNIENGVMYLADQYRHLMEIPNHFERLRFALASYNGGRGYINLALRFGRAAEGLPFFHGNWKAAGRPAGSWQTWEVSRVFMADERFEHKGLRPDHKQMWDYVEKITARFNYYVYRKSEA